MHGRRLLALILSGFLLGLTAGCHSNELPFAETEDSPPPNEVIALASQFTPDTAATIRGRVVWEGQQPEVPPFLVTGNFLYFPRWQEVERTYANPHAPRIHAANLGLQGVVVFLRQIDPRLSKPWHHGPVTVEMREDELAIRQDGQSFAAGFVRKGDAITLLSGEERYHMVRGMGGDYFTLTLPKPHQQRQRILPRTGVVELTSAAGYYWLRGHLFVSEHPYYTRSNENGEFTLEQVPPGRYELVAWMPRWNVVERHYDPEALGVSRLYYAPPLQITQVVEVSERQEAVVEFAVREAMFGNP
jgi:hypothetical protein